MDPLTSRHLSSSIFASGSDAADANDGCAGHTPPGDLRGAACGHRGQIGDGHAANNRGLN